MWCKSNWCKTKSHLYIEHTMLNLCLLHIFFLMQRRQQKKVSTNPNRRHKHLQKIMSRMAERAKRSDVFPGKHSDSDVLHDASFPGNLESLQHSQRGGFSSHEAYSVPKTRERRDYSGSVYNDASFSSSFPKGNFETRRSLGSMEVVNSNRKSPGYRTKMRSVEHRNSEDSHGTIPEASSRSSSSSQKSKKNEIFREDVSQRDKTPHSDPPHGKGDGKNRKQSIDRRNHAKQENTNTSRSMPDELEGELRKKRKSCHFLLTISQISFRAPFLWQRFP